ncbi:RUS1 family protein [Abortiporus biennis]
MYGQRHALRSSLALCSLHNPRCLRFLPPVSYRFISTKRPTALQNSSTPKQRRFAVEHVDGREQHISWTSRGGIEKEWKESDLAECPRYTSLTPWESITGRVSSWFRQMFLPTNYPHSVHPSYARYHIFQFFETTLGTLVSVLCNQALLSSVGVSAEGSIFGAVAVQWIIKDGAGEIAKLFFIRRFSPYFDSHPKTFNFSGEAIAYLGSGLQIATLLVNPTPLNFVLCAAGGNIFKLIGNAIWFTTHIKFVRYFSQQGNVGDVAAKEESQASIAQLFGYAAGAGLLTVSHSATYLYSIFFLSIPIHLITTVYMLRVATFELLTLPRVTVLAHDFSESDDDTNKGTVMSFAEMETSRRTGVFGEFYKNKRDRCVVLAPTVSQVVSSGSLDDQDRWYTCASVFKDSNYLLYPSPQSPLTTPISVFYSPSVTSDDMFKSILHASRLRQHLETFLPSPESEISHQSLEVFLDETKVWVDARFDQFKLQLEEKGWRTDELGFADHGRRVTWYSKDDP